MKWTMALVLVSTHKWVLVLCSLGCACTNIGAHPKIQNVQRISEWDGSEHKEEVMPAFSIKVCMFLDAVGTPVLLFQKEGRRSEAREYLALRDLHDERLRAQGVRSWRRLTAQWLMCCGWRTTSVMIVPRDTENKGVFGTAGAHPQRAVVRSVSTLGEAGMEAASCLCSVTGG